MNRMPRVKISNGRSLGYVEAGGGDRTPIVFLHGVGSDKSVWRPQLDHFGKTRRAVAFDYPGYGDSDSAPEGTTRDDYAAAILSAMDELRIARAHICGLSLGGVVAIAVYHARWWSCASFVLADTFAVHPDGRGIYDRSVAGSADMRAFAEARADFLLAQPADPEVRREIVETMARIDPTAYRIGAEAVWLVDQRERVRRIARQTLIVCGEEDRPTPPELSRELQALIPTAHVAIISNAGHLSNLEQPEEFNRLVGDFIGGVDSTDRFVTPLTWKDAARLVEFKPIVPRKTRGRQLKRFRVHIRDHKARDLPKRERTLEAYYDGFAFTQRLRSPDDARRDAMGPRYGPKTRDVVIGGHQGSMRELGPEVAPDDIDGRDSAIITWSDGPMFYFFFGSREMTLAELLPIARSLYR
jgi:3-oxoadipate enol-lactonase